MSLLRKASFTPSRYEGLVTLLVYTFPLDDKGEAFDWIEFSILKSWQVLGKMKTVIVTSHRFEKLNRFAEHHAEIEVQVETALRPGDIGSMSLDCIIKLWQRFTTPEVLIIQDDGWPLQDTLNEFLGKYDFIGAPSVRDSRRRFLNAIGLAGLNGGFSLRSRKICRAAARDWKWFWRFFFSKKKSRFFSEDTFYMVTARLNPVYHFAHKFPSEDEAFRFSYDELAGIIAPPQEKPFGFHGKKTAEYYFGVC